MANIFNSDVSFIGELTLSLSDASQAERFMTIDGTGIVRYREVADVMTDLGIGTPLTTVGDIYVYSTTNEEDRLAVGTNGQILSADSTEDTGLVWMDPEWLGEAPNDGQEWVRKNEGWVLNTGGSSTGETNTASSIGTGISLYSQKVGSDLQFNSIVNLSASGLTVALDGNKDINFTFDETSISITESQISDLTPHVTNNNQLINGAGYITAFTDTQRTDEEIRDVAAAQWISGTNTTVVYDDLLNTIKINSTDTIYTLPFADNSSNWNTAFGWGNHSGLYMPIGQQLAVTKTLAANEYLTSYDATTGLFTSAVVTGGVTDHTLLTNIGTNTHAQIDTHIAEATIHFTENPNWNTAFGWGDHLGLYVGLTGDETVAGIKTFSSFSVTPSAPPILDYNVANKKYVDDSIVAAGGYTDEQAQDAVGNIMSGTGATSVVYNDTLNTIVISSTDTTYTNLSEFINDSGYLTSFTETDPIFLASDAYNVTAALITNWNTAYTNRIDSLTTTGTSGAATLTGNVLNIPEYANDNNIDYISGGSWNSTTGLLLLTGVGNAGTTIAAANLLTYLNANLTFPSEMVYPGAGIALSTGSAWDTSITDNSANWNTAYGWGDHSTEGYLTSFDITAQTDPKYLRSDVADTALGAITFNNGTTHISNIDLNENVRIRFDIDSDIFNSIVYDSTISAMTYYSSGSHIFKNGEDDGYETLVAFAYSTFGGTSSQFLKADGTLDNNTYLTSFTETDPIFQAHVSSGIITQDITNWNTAFGWGNHATQGYLTSETDSQTLSFGLSTGQLTISNGNTISLDGRYLTSFDITTQTDTKYLRSDVADTKTGGNLIFNDNIKLVLGSSADAQFYHNTFFNLLDLYGHDFKIRDNSTDRFTFGRTTGDFTNAGTITSQGTGDSSFAGNVGIGTTNPESRLHIYELGADSPTTLILENGDVGINDTEDVHKIEFQSNDASANGVGVAASIRVVAENAGNIYGLAFNTQNVADRGERVRIDGAGNVGIGTTNPDGKLHINGITSALPGVVLEVAESVSNNKLIDIHNTGGAKRFGIEYDNTSISLKITNRSGDIIASFIEGTKNVGIGTTNPSYKLDVSGTSRFTDTIKTNGDMIVDNSTNASVVIDRGSSSDQGLTKYLTAGSSKWLVGQRIVASDNFAFYSYGTSSDVFHINFSTGNTGIGNSNNTYKLDVSGTGRFTSTVTSTNFILSSDKRLKTKIKDFDYGQHIKMDVKTYELKSEKGVKRTGVIAQELEVNHPEFVRTDDEGVKSVAYIDLLMAKIAELEARLEKAGI